MYRLMPPALPRRLPLVSASHDSSTQFPYFASHPLISVRDTACGGPLPSLEPKSEVRKNPNASPISPTPPPVSCTSVPFCSLRRFDQFSCSSEPRASWRGVLSNTCTLLPHPSLQARPLSHTDSFLQRRTIDYTNTLAPRPRRATVDARLCVVFCGVRRAGKGLSPLEQWPPGARTTAAHFWGAPRRHC